MGFAVVSVTNEFWEPLKNVVVEAFDLDDPTSVVDSAETDTAGVATLLSLPAGTRVFFKPRITRTQGEYRGGEKDTSLYGKVRMQILAHSGGECYDAIVEPTGEWGSYETIQAAIDDLEAVGTSKWTIFVVGGQYTEALTISNAQTAPLHFVGDCKRSAGLWRDVNANAPSTGELAVKVFPSGQGIALTYRSSLVAGANVIFEGFHFRSTNTTSVVSCGLGGLRFIECAIVQAGTGGGIIGNQVGGLGADLFWIENSQVRTASANVHAINFSGQTFRAINCNFEGIVKWLGVSGFVMTNCLVEATTNAGQAVLNLDGNLTLIRNYRLVNNRIRQKGAGDGVYFNGPAGSDGFLLVGNHIEGAGNGVSGTAILIGTDSEAVSGLNYLKGWTNGINNAGTAIFFPDYFDGVGTSIAAAGTGGMDAAELAAMGILTTSTGAPIGAAYVTIGADATLTAERALTGSTSILVSDGGANNPVTLSVIAGGVDHGGLAGLADDDHTQYLLLAGRGAQQDITGGITVSTYARVGSATAPANTTAGDLTAIRLSLGNTAFSASGQELLANKTRTTTSAGSEAFYGFIGNVAPAAPSSTEFRVFTMSAVVTAGAAGATITTVSPIFLEIRHRTAETITTIRGQNISTIVLDSAAPATAGTVTTAVGLNLNSYGRPSGTSVVSVTNLIGIDIDRITHGGLTVTGTMLGLRVRNPTVAISGTFTQLGIDIEQPTRGTTNIGFRNAGSSVFTPSTAQNITAVGTAILADATIVQLTANASYTLTSTPTIADGQNGQEVTIINVDTADTITLQDQGTLAGSNLRLSANTIAIPPRGSITLVYNSTIGDWVQIGQTTVL